MSQILPLGFVYLSLSVSKIYTEINSAHDASLADVEQDPGAIALMKWLFPAPVAPTNTIIDVCSASRN